MIKGLEDIDLRSMIEFETNNKFDKDGFINCPFHTEKHASLTTKFYKGNNKESFKCFGCGAHGDALNFIMKFKGLNYVEARKYLGLPVKNDYKQEQLEKVKNYINWQIQNQKPKRFIRLIDIYQFVDNRNKTIYFKAKLMSIDNKKTMLYYHIDSSSGKVINTRETKEVPYNLFKVAKTIQNDGIVIITEGEKDADTLNSILDNTKYQATSIKGVSDLNDLKNARIFVCGDTGQAGELYKKHVYDKLFSSAKEYRVINLPRIEELGGNKDVTDWLESGNTKEDLLKAFSKSLDFKDQNQLQQNETGIYKFEYDKKNERYVKIYITNFNLLAAKSIKCIDDEVEGLELILKTNENKQIKRKGYVTILDDLKTFKNFLNSIELAFLGKSEDLIKLKQWISKYYINEEYELLDGSGFVEKNNKLLFTTSKGSFNDKIYNNVKCSDRSFDNIIDIMPINKEEMIKVMDNLFDFTTKARACCIVGTIVNNLAIMQAIQLKIKFHHLLVVGESGSGKSTILDNVIAPILNYPITNIKSIGLITPFALVKELSVGNYPVIFEEFKPSKFDSNKINKISDTLRNLYDRTTVSRGDKTLLSKNFQLKRPLIMAGEESYSDNETALIERSCIIYLSKYERTDKNAEAMLNLINDEELLNKLGKSLINIILNLELEEYKQIRDNVSNKIDKLNNRPLNTAINICTGMEILNKLLEKLDLPKFENYFTEVVNNITKEILEDNKDTHSVIENMLILFNTLLETGRINYTGVICNRDDGFFIKTEEMLTRIRVHVKETNLQMTILSERDFKTQASKSGYLLEKSKKQIKINGRNIKFDLYNKEKLKQLGVDSIINIQ